MLECPVALDVVIQFTDMSEVRLYDGAEIFVGFFGRFAGCNARSVWHGNFSIMMAPNNIIIFL